MSRRRFRYELIRDRLDLNEWQIAEIKSALREADAGDFTGDEEVQAVTREWRSGT
jgi:RHH-type rel operon transcriptional repressor/antitoxin RelB